MNSTDRPTEQDRDDQARADDNDASIERSDHEVAEQAATETPED